MASIDDLRLFEQRPVTTGRRRVLGFVFARAVWAPFAALQLQVELASQPEQQRTSTVGSPTTAARALQTAASPAGSLREGIGHV